MPAVAKPAHEVVRSQAWIASAAVLLGALAFAYAPLLAYSFGQWLKPDYSHGFLVPLFSAYLIYRWWPDAPRTLAWPEPWGLALLAGGMVLFALAGIMNIGKEWLQGFSLVVNLCGVLVLLGGWAALRWAWPAAAFLLFMFPLPYEVEHALGWYLQKIAAVASAFVLQVLGYPTYREGNILHSGDHVLEVAQACNGLSMLLTFAALAVGMVLVTTRPWLDRALILLAAVPVAVISNVIRIALTGVLYNTGGKELGDRLFHDFAGWVMMPIALLLMWGMLKVFDWVYVADREPASREEVIRSNAANPAFLFMHAVPDADPKRPPVPPGVPVPGAPPAPGTRR